MTEMTTGQYADRVGVSDQTVRNWCEQGLVPARRDDRRRWRICAPEADRALETNRRASGHGGPRRNAGRKPEDRDSLGYRDAETVAAVAERDTPPPGALHLSELLLFTREETRALIAVGERAGLGPRQFDLLKTWEMTRKLRLENDSRAGKLVDAAAVADAARNAASALALILQTLPARVADAAEQWIPDDRAAQIVDLLRAADTDPDLTDAVATLLERPRGLAARVRAVVQAEIDRANADVVAWAERQA